MRKAVTTSLFLFLPILLICPPALCEEFTGQVVRIIDGDTMEVIHLGQPERVRLHGVDCPEISQPYGERARRYTSTHTLGKTVTVVVADRDTDGVTAGQVILPDMSNLNIVIISSGLAWWQETSGPEDKILMDVQESARSARRGLWADNDPVPPWEWRSKPEKTGR